MLEEPLYESPWSGNKEWWVLNPGPFIDICFNHGIVNYVFTEKVYRFAPNMRLHPEKLLEAAARGRPWRAILVEADYGDKKVAQVAVEYTSEAWFEKPVGVYPIWSASRHELEDLIVACEGFDPGRPIGRFFGDALDMEVQEDQDRRVLVKNPPVHNEPWNDYFLAVSRIKRKYPDVTFHIHGGKNLSRTLGTGVDAFDHPVRTRWVDGLPKILLPNGREIKWTDEYKQETKLWANFIGTKVSWVFGSTDLEVTARRAYEFSLRSIKWACGNYEKVWTPGTGGLATDEGFDHEVPDQEWEPIQDLVTMPKHIKRERFDMWLCDVCSLAVSCPYSRPGAVCIVDEAETVELAKKFRSRRSSDIIDGLGSLLDANIKRLNRGMGRELENEGQIDPNVTKLVESIFDRGVQLAKMVDPLMAAQMHAGAKVAVGIVTPGGATRVQAGTPQELMAGVAKMLEAEGISIEQATPDDVERVLGMVPRGEVLDVESSDTGDATP
jgi:hypothetical protein